MNKFTSIAIGAGIVAIGSITSLVLPTQSAYGYGECTAPDHLSTEWVEDGRAHIDFTWGEYDFSLCDSTLTTVAYELQIRDLDNNIIREKTREQENRYELPPSTAKVGTGHNRYLQYMTDYKFRIRAVSDDDSVSNWSTYYSFTTPVEPFYFNLTVDELSYDDDTKISDQTIGWQTLNSNDNFKYYRLKVSQRYYEAVSSSEYQLNTTEILNKKMKNVERDNVDVSGFYDWSVTDQGQPFNYYYYDITLISVHKIDGEKVRQSYTYEYRVSGGNAELVDVAHEFSGDLVD